MSPEQENPDMDPVPGAPSDNTTAVAELEQLRQQGYDADFVVQEGGAVRCTSCRKVEQPGDLQVDVFRRLEGASDPDDMTVIVALTCRECGAKGVVMIGYGPNASPDEGDLLLALDTPEEEGTDGAVDRSA